MTDPAEDGLVVLMPCASMVEASVARGLLEAQGIQCAVHGEQALGALPHLLSGVVPTLRVLVHSSDLERAETLISSEPLLQATPSEGSHGETHCPVHDKVAIAICSRCGIFLCEDCRALGDPPLCEDCLGSAQPRPQKTWIRVVTVLLLLPFGLALAKSLLAAVLRVLGVVGP